MLVGDLKYDDINIRVRMLHQMLVMFQWRNRLMLAHVNPASEVHTSIQVLPCALDELYLGDIDG